MITRHTVAVVSLAAFVAIGATLAAVSAGFAQSQRRTIDRVVSLHTPDESTIPEGPVGAAVRYGKKVLTDTQTYARAYIGNGLNCSSCHLDAGTRPYASPWVGLWGVFPEYRSRNAKVNALQDRINDCFQRSMNGRPLPVDSAEMGGMLAYMWWLSKDVPVGKDVEGRGFKRINLPDPAQIDVDRGKMLYEQSCAACHGIDGQGQTGASGEYLFPALWGPRSFNIGAGMARLSNAAAFIKTNMPLGASNSLPDRDAIDIAAYFTRQPRPDFAAKNLDWPKGNK